ncbi:hypothetical protein ANCCAN_05241 [Ancylostoma caninum]|uniref:Uncharacterized protein n=1 Tax=Ancylostoma caninum TaxID=29170 RepID=A0A368GW60_ANCCA|nr:hypothetical protein ANCCAN_05241 [Ancylostoma caninum]
MSEITVKNSKRLLRMQEKKRKMMKRREKRMRMTMARHQLRESPVLVHRLLHRQQKRTNPTCKRLLRRASRRRRC